MPVYFLNLPTFPKSCRQVSSLYFLNAPYTVSPPNSAPVMVTVICQLGEAVCGAQLSGQTLI